MRAGRGTSVNFITPAAKKAEAGEHLHKEQQNCVQFMVATAPQLLKPLTEH